ncbi:MAG: indolepyruvate ferredoxin oxidoreductase family protein [Limnobacter sp.]|nr:indolepyruvate ferredoxin oxidoreductase family protein [Limnobacter sp.]
MAATAYKHDIYSKTEGKVYMTGIQALVRLPMVQRTLDRKRGLNTAGLVSGYRGSPLGAYDQQLWKASKQLAEHDVVFQPGLNEDLAATALWGAQMHKAYGETKVDGVFGVWYGKGPGVDRTGDVFRTANMLGTSKLGGVLAVSGDDHAAQSSMYPHQTDGIFQSASIPILQPANVQEILSLGLAGFEMSRYAGVWVALKTIAEVVETAATFDLSDVPQYKEPEDFVVPAHGLNWDPSIAWPEKRAEFERRMIEERLPAVKAWAKVNKIDQTIVKAFQRKLGVITVGKAHQDFMQAMEDLGLNTADLANMGVSVYKVAMSWPLETDGILAFAAGQNELMVVEEKRGIVEAQIKEALYHQPTEQRPRVTGKFDDRGVVLLPEVSEFTPLLVSKAFVGRLIANSLQDWNLGSSNELGKYVPTIHERLDRAMGRSTPVSAVRNKVIPIRAPFFCSGCPHNTSTKTPEGSISGGGIGCHVMALSQPALKTKTFSQMGGEGAQWIGAAPFSKTEHIFQNLGDGTYQHSGLLAIRAAVAAKANITYKILYNDAVAMTGGQAAEGQIDPARITRQLQAEGVEKILLVSDNPDRWTGDPALAKGVTIHHRDHMDAVQRELREIGGVSAIVYEQTCAAEKRRRRKRGEFPDPNKRLFINQRVCEGCGDCSVQSNCISIEPVQTDFGRKRSINQNACNKDFSCVKGFCPSFVEVEGAQLRKPDSKRIKEWEVSLSQSMPNPVVPQLHSAFNVVVTGIGGTGVLTMGALIGGAAHVQGLGSTVLDFTGLAQKNGAVISQVRIAKHSKDIHAVRIGPGSADLLLGADLVVSAGADTLSKLASDSTAAVVNTGEAPTAAVITDRDATLPMGMLHERVKERCDASRFYSFDASELAERLFGDTVTAHTLMLGYAWQKGLIPLSKDAIEQTIELNGAAVTQNLRAFLWGRIAAELPNVMSMLEGHEVSMTPAPMGVDELIAKFSAELVAYQNQAYADRFEALVQTVRTTEQKANPGQTGFTEAVARSAYKLMAYKDEYEVARLYSTDEFIASLQGQFSSSTGISLWLAPPLMSRIDPATGRPKKIKFGSWVLKVFKVMSAFKGLRGTALDVFGYTQERRHERRLIAEYFQMIEGLCPQLNVSTIQHLTEIAKLPMDIRGYGPVKAQAMVAYEQKKAQMLSLDGELAQATDAQKEVESPLAA